MPIETAQLAKVSSSTMNISTYIASTHHLSTDEEEVLTKERVLPSASSSHVHLLITKVTLSY